MLKRTASFAATSLVFAVLTGCAQDMCKNSATATVASPNGELKAVVYSRDCGAGTNYDAHLSLLAKDKEVPVERGNVLVTAQKTPISVRWEGDKILHVRVDPAVPTVAHEAHLKGVKIVYEKP